MLAKAYLPAAVAAIFAFGLAGAVVPVSQPCFQNAVQACILAGKGITVQGSGIIRSGPYGPVGTVYLIDFENGGSGTLEGCSGGKATWKFTYEQKSFKGAEYDGSAQPDKGTLTASFGDQKPVTKAKETTGVVGEDLLVYCANA